MIRCSSLCPKTGTQGCLPAVERAAFGLLPLSLDTRSKAACLGSTDGLERVNQCGDPHGPPPRICSMDLLALLLSYQPRAS